MLRDERPEALPQAAPIHRAGRAMEAAPGASYLLGGHAVESLCLRVQAGEMC